MVISDEDNFNEIQAQWAAVRGKIRQKKYLKIAYGPDTIKIKEKKEKDKFELFFKDKSKKIFKVIQNVNGRDFIWEDL